MNTPTPIEQEELRIAIAEEMGFSHFHFNPDDGMLTSGIWGSRKLVPSYTTSLDSIQAACLERFKREIDIARFTSAIYEQTDKTNPWLYSWQLTALDWCIAFARTAKIWRYKE